MDRCQFGGCSRQVSKAGHTLCLEHWKSQQAEKVLRAAAADEDDSPAGWPGYLSSTKIGEHLGLSSVQMDLILEVLCKFRIEGA